MTLKEQLNTLYGEGHAAAMAKEYTDALDRVGNPDVRLGRYIMCTLPDVPKSSIIIPNDEYEDGSNYTYGLTSALQDASHLLLVQVPAYCGVPVMEDPTVRVIIGDDIQCSWGMKEVARMCGWEDS